MKNKISMAILRLAQAGPVTASSVWRVTPFSYASILRHLRHLDAVGLITRSMLPSKRIKAYCITAQGRRAFARTTLQSRQGQE